MKGQYANEENHQKIRRKLKKSSKICLAIGIPVLIAGIVLFIIGFSNFNSSSISTAGSKMAMLAGGSFVIFIGFVLSAVGIYTTFFAHAREISSYTASSIAPVIKDTAEYLAPTTNNVVKEISESVSEGIAKGKSSSNKGANAGKVVCQNCGHKNESTAKFCSNCGNAITQDKFCTACGTKLENNDKFCPNCGQKQ